jgi:hypothetical protein
LVPTSLAASILPESPKRGTRAAGTSEKEVRFGISLCAATPPTSAGRRAPDTPAADESPRTLVHKVRQLGTNRPRGKNPVGSKTAFSGPAKNASPPRAAGKFHCCTPSFSTDADLIAESICLVSASEVRRERSVLAIKACNEGSKPQDIPSDHKTRQGASAEARYDTSNTGVPAR